MRKHNIKFLNDIKYILGLFCLFLYPLSIKAQDTLIYPSDSAFLDIAPFCQVYKDENATLAFEQIKNLPDSLFQKTPSGNLSFGSTKASIWVKFTLKNQTTEPLYLTFWGWGINYLDLYIVNENGELMVRQTGALRSFMSRDLKRGHIAINIGQSPKEVYINLQSTWMINTHVSISALKPLSNIYYGRDTFNGICMGILIAMALYNLFLYFSVKERLYLYYFAYILLALVAVSELNSSYRFFIGWGKGVGLRELMFIMGIIFSMRFLNIRDTMPRGHKLLACIIILFISSGILNMVGWQFFSNQIYQLTALSTIFIIPSLAFLSYQGGNKSALFFFIAWFFLAVSGFFTLLTQNMGIIPFTFWTNSLFAIGTCLETILLAFALAYRLKTYREESKMAQELAIQRLEENEQLVKEQNKLLEEKVQQRTVALEQSLQHLNATQAQLIQQEKLASLGELTAGIAHEIQNPLNFVNNFSELSVDLVKDLKDELKRPDKDENYITELFDDLSSNQVRINHHGKRASNIVKGMLEHSRTNTGERQLTNINALCDEYLRLAFHGMRAKDKSFNADFKTDLDPNLPKINIVPQDIGRVLLNLINNAFYAVHQKSKSAANYTPSVFLTTEQFDNQAIIKVKDNGEGISEDVVAHIFQPFFTTKPTGEGTGLGLSLSYDIVTKGHGGTLDVESTEGVGTTFIITLHI